MDFNQVPSDPEDIPEFVISNVIDSKICVTKHTPTTSIDSDEKSNVSSQSNFACENSEQFLDSGICSENCELRSLKSNGDEAPPEIHRPHIESPIISRPPGSVDTLEINKLLESVQDNEHHDISVSTNISCTVNSDDSSKKLSSIKSMDVTSSGLINAIENETNQVDSISKSSQSSLTPPSTPVKPSLVIKSNARQPDSPTIPFSRSFSTSSLSSINPLTQVRSEIPTVYCPPRSIWHAMEPFPTLGDDSMVTCQSVPVLSQVNVVSPPLMSPTVNPQTEVESLSSSEAITQSSDLYPPFTMNSLPADLEFRRKVPILPLSMRSSSFPLSSPVPSPVPHASRLPHSPTDTLSAYYSPSNQINGQPVTPLRFETPRTHCPPMRTFWGSADEEQTRMNKVNSMLSSNSQFNSNQCENNSRNPSSLWKDSLGKKEIIPLSTFRQTSLSSAVSPPNMSHQSTVSSSVSLLNNGSTKDSHSRSVHLETMIKPANSMARSKPPLPANLSTPYSPGTPFSRSFSVSTNDSLRSESPRFYTPTAPKPSAYQVDSQRSYEPEKTFSFPNSISSLGTPSGPLLSSFVERTQTNLNITDKPPTYYRLPGSAIPMSSSPKNSPPSFTDKTSFFRGYQSLPSSRDPSPTSSLSSYRPSNVMNGLPSSASSSPLKNRPSSRTNASLESNVAAIIASFNERASNKSSPTLPPISRSSSFRSPMSTSISKPIFSKFSSFKLSNTRPDEFFEGSSPSTPSVSTRSPDLSFNEEDGNLSSIERIVSGNEASISIATESHNNEDDDSHENKNENDHSLIVTEEDNKNADKQEILKNVDDATKISCESGQDVPFLKPLLPDRSNTSKISADINPLAPRSTLNLKPRYYVMEDRPRPRGKLSDSFLNADRPSLTNDANTPAMDVHLPIPMESVLCLKSEEVNPFQYSPRLSSGYENGTRSASQSPMRSKTSTSTSRPSSTKKSFRNHRNTKSPRNHDNKIVDADTNGDDTNQKPRRVNAYLDFVDRHSLVDKRNPSPSTHNGDGLSIASESSEIAIPSIFPFSDDISRISSPINADTEPVISSAAAETSNVSANAQSYDLVANPLAVNMNLVSKETIWKESSVVPHAIPETEPSFPSTILAPSSNVSHPPLPLQPIDPCVDQPVFRGSGKQRITYNSTIGNVDNNGKRSRFRHLSAAHPIKGPLEKPSVILSNRFRSLVNNAALGNVSSKVDGSSSKGKENTRPILPPLELPKVSNRSSINIINASSTTETISITTSSIQRFNSQTNRRKVELYLLGMKKVPVSRLYRDIVDSEPSINLSSSNSGSSSINQDSDVSKKSRGRSLSYMSCAVIFLVSLRMILHSPSNLTERLQLRESLISFENIEREIVVHKIIEKKSPIVSVDKPLDIKIPLIQESIPSPAEKGLVDTRGHSFSFRKDDHHAIDGAYFVESKDRQTNHSTSDPVIDLIVSKKPISFNLRQPSVIVNHLKKILNPLYIAGLLWDAIKGLFLRHMGGSSSRRTDYINQSLFSK